VKIETLNFKDLKDYQRIPMIKDSSMRYEFINPRTYVKYNIPRIMYDMNDEEDISLSKEIIRFDTSMIFVIKEKEMMVAGAIVATHSPKIHLLKGFNHTAILWDIRVNPEYQKQGFGKKLMNEAINFAKTQGCNQLLIETQDNNPNAIDFYLKCGASLYEIRENVYSDQPLEKQLLFILKI
jgi:ribosomal protein S18 acetylase RimI-like enzyme